MNSDPDFYRREKIIVLIGLILYWFVITLAQVLIAPTGTAWGAMFFLTSIGWGFGILYWCMADSRERGEELSGAAKIAIVVFAIFALIWYLFHTRGGKGGFKALGWLLLYAVGGFVLVTMMATAVLTALHLAGIRPIM
jgi:hypothetical protein